MTPGCCECIFLLTREIISLFLVVVCVVYVGFFSFLGHISIPMLNILENLKPRCFL